MPEAVPNPELLQSLGRLVRGLSALFWGLPAVLIVCVGTAGEGWFNLYGIFGVLPAMAATGVPVFGLWQLDGFQKQERPWLNALDRAKIFAMITFGLSPFAFWWHHAPHVPLFDISVRALALSAWFLLFNLNTVLLRLGAMLPDETLRHETRQFTSLNRSLLLILLLILVLQTALDRIPRVPQEFAGLLFWWEQAFFWLVLLVGLLPLAMTMAMIWKTKEVILDSVFGGKN